MKTIKQNGYEFTYDDSFKPGDLISTYYSGFFEFVSSEDRGPNSSPLYHFRKKYDKNGKPINKKTTDQCDAVYCRRSSEVISEQMSMHELAIVRLRKLLELLNG